jgi:hypothetical protein
MDSGRTDSADDDLRALHALCDFFDAVRFDIRRQFTFEPLMKMLCLAARDDLPVQMRADEPHLMSIV